MEKKNKSLTQATMKVIKEESKKYEKFKTS
jgi:hypothetical protein